MSRTSLCLKEHSLRQTEHAFCVVDRSLRQLILGLSRLSLLAPAGVYDVIRFLTGQSERVVEDNKSAVPSRSLPPLVSPTALFLLSTHTHIHPSRIHAGTTKRRAGRCAHPRLGSGEIGFRFH